jgi:hypothetical protein
MKFLITLLTALIYFSGALGADKEPKNNSNLPSNTSALKLTESFLTVTNNSNNRSHLLIKFYPNFFAYVQERYDQELEAQEKKETSAQSETEELVEVYTV